MILQIAISINNRKPRRFCHICGGAKKTLTRGLEANTARMEEVSKGQEVFTYFRERRSVFAHETVVHLLMIRRDERAPIISKW